MRDTNKSADEYGMIVNQLFMYEGLKISDVDDVIISTVVPSVLYTLQHLAMKYFQVVNFVCLPYAEFMQKKSWYLYFRNIESEGEVLYG